jgi:hypothetical protein
MTDQPKWQLIANLGDATPLDYGGLFVFRDETGVHPEEMELLEVQNPDADDDDLRYEVRRCVLERCTLTGGILSDNSFHPEHPAWFAADLAGVASAIGSTKEDLERLLCSEDPLERAEAYRAVADYHGWDNLDSDPLTLTRAEAEARVNAMTEQVPAY